VGRGHALQVRALFRILCTLAGLWLLIAPRVVLAQASANLLSGARPIESRGVTEVDRLTDDVAAFDGDTWKTQLSARFSDLESFVTFDLGSERAIDALFLQGDNNDRYEVALSSDGRSFQPVWVAAEQRRGGLQARSTKDLRARGRYLRLKPVSGDDALAVAELQAFEAVPVTFPPEVPRKSGVSLERRVRDRTLVFGVALIFALLLVRSRARPGLYAIAAIAVLAAGFSLAPAFVAAWPVSNREVSLVRAVVAVVAAVAVARLGFAAARYPAHRPLCASILGLCAVVGVLAFYNLGQPQFYDVGARQPTFAHYLDLRQYYTSAKYFRELGYEGTYEADLLAYTADSGQSLESLAKTPMRDLYTLRDSRVGDQIAHIEARREHFTPERFEQYRADARFFRSVMGTRHYLETLQDFGANATPFWMSLAHAMFSAIPPSNTAFTITGSLDVLLLLVTLVAIGRSFGLVAALVSAVVFGANDFVMYGTNWAGATLRHDWLFCLGLGACALRRERFALGGALLGFSTMIRAFPALALIGVGLAALFREVLAYREVKRLPTRAELVGRQRDTLRVFAGALGAAIVAFLLARVVLPDASWIDWYKKVALGDAEPHPATLGLRVLLGGSDFNQASVLRARMPVYAAALVLFGGAVALACRGRRLEHAALLGLVLVPVVFSPAPYYLHLVFLLPLLAFDRDCRGAGFAPLSAKSAGIVLSLLLLCAAQYVAAPISDWALHFSLENALLFVAIAVLLLLLELDRLRAFLSEAPEGAEQSGN
jgi:hypothetical protein